MVNKITGNGENRRVWIDGEELFPEPSLKVANHSPDGFNWGYGGSGPAQLALAILLKFTDEHTAVRLYQRFKFDIISGLTHDFILHLDVPVWIRDHRKEAGLEEGQEK